MPRKLTPNYFAILFLFGFRHSNFDRQAHTMSFLRRYCLGKIRCDENLFAQDYFLFLLFALLFFCNHSMPPFHVTEHQEIIK